MNSLLAALQFLTRLPVSGLVDTHSEFSEVQAGSAVAWYGVVGIIIGLTLIALAWFFISVLGLPILLVAVLLVTFWILITGALHLDGLADCGDAWMGGHDKERMLTILQDTHCGVGAIFSTLAIILIKFSALVFVLEQGAFLTILFSTVLARLTLTGCIAYFPYVRNNGLGSSLQQQVVKRDVLLFGAGLIISLSVISLSGLIYGLIGCLLALLALFILLIRKLGGFTGDVYGALVEMCETFILITLCFYITGNA